MALDFDPLDLGRHADALGDPADWFVDSQLHYPRVVRHSSGRAEYLIDAEGSLRPLAELPSLPGHLLPRAVHLGHRYEFGPAPDAKGPGIDLASAPGAFRLGAVVTNPG